MNKGKNRIVQNLLNKRPFERKAIGITLKLSSFKKQSKRGKVNQEGGNSASPGVVARKTEKLDIGFGFCSRDVVRHDLSVVPKKHGFVPYYLFVGHLTLRVRCFSVTLIIER